MKKEEMQTLTIVLTFILVFFISYSMEIYVYLEIAEASCLTYKEDGSMGGKVPEKTENDDKRRTVDAGKYTEEATNKSGEAGKLPPKMIFIKGGCFQMGPPKDDGLTNNNTPIHEVCLDDYYIGEHEVTWGQWKSIMGADLSGLYRYRYCDDLPIGDDRLVYDDKPIHVNLDDYYTKYGEHTRGQWKNIMGANPSGLCKYCEDLPVEDVNWNVVQLFIEKLNKVTGKTYRLPTEAEWEYAARERGQPQKYSGTNNKNDLRREYAWFWDQPNFVPKPVKSKKPNSIGLYDMTGNVYEWVHDWYDEHYYSISPIHNPTGPNSGSERVMRGGYWGGVKWLSHAIDRDSYRPDSSLMGIGFRLAKSAKK